jgi:LysM repeat protein
LITRFLWAAAGAVGALVIVAGLALYSTPETLVPDRGTEASVGATGAPGAEVSSATLPELAAGATKPSTYTVRPGDTLGKIARDLDISLIALLAANDISADTVVRVEDRLLVPATAGPPPEEAQPTDDSP